MTLQWQSQKTLKLQLLPGKQKQRKDTAKPKKTNCKVFLKNTEVKEGEAWFKASLKSSFTELLCLLSSTCLNSSYVLQFTNLSACSEVSVLYFLNDDPYTATHILSQIRDENIGHIRNKLPGLFFGKFSFNDFDLNTWHLLFPCILLFTPLFLRFYWIFDQTY